MMAVPITVVFWAVVAMLSLLAVLTIYLFAARWVEDRKQEAAVAYVERNRIKWYRVLRGLEEADASLVPENEAERMAVEEIFRSYMKNLSDPEINGRIRGFAETYLAYFYKRKLRSRDWSTRMNALYRIEDFKISNLLEDLRKLDRKKLSAEETFQLLMIELQFEPDRFLERTAGHLGQLTEYEARQLFFLMPDYLFEQVENRFPDLEPVLRYALIEVLGMRQDLAKLPFLEGLLDSPDDETRIRALRAIDALGIRTPNRILKQAINSTVWEERFLAGRMLHRLHPGEAAVFAEQLKEDPSWLVRQEILTLSKKIYGAKTADQNDGEEVSGWRR
ncbi:HEAT repeat domain-containing protein [Bhargavaea ginsengi]|uniref:HEAT repeat domain-containing protein n=1 Tax=Bhargavaea ginsengi TaxID=426757 RepID=UPI003C7537ED